MTGVALSGCGDFAAEIGKRPNLTALTESLRVQQSTREQVHSALGVPYGQGRIMMPWEEKPREVWTYYYEAGRISLGGGESDMRRTFLFVYLDGDRYDGHMWFSSLPDALKR